MSIHVVCHACPFEGAVDTEDEARAKAETHLATTGHTVDWEHFDGRLVTDGGHYDVDGGAEDPALRQARALERLADEMAYQNAVLTELAHAVHRVAVSANEFSDPEERAESVPSMRGLETNIEDQRFTREEADR